MSDAVCAGDVHRPGSRAPDRAPDRARADERVRVGQASERVRRGEGSGRVRRARRVMGCDLGSKSESPVLVASGSKSKLVGA